MINVSLRRAFRGVRLGGSLLYYGRSALGMGALRGHVTCRVANINNFHGLNANCTVVNETVSLKPVRI